MRDRDPPKGFASATMYELIFCRRDPASRMNCKLGSCTAASYRSLFLVNHSLLLFFAKSLKNPKKSVVKYFDFSVISGSLRRHRGSPVEHWRERSGVEDGADRADLVAADVVPLADERRPRGSVRHHVVQETDVVAVDERLLRLDACADMMQVSQCFQVRP